MAKRILRVVVAVAVATCAALMLQPRANVHARGHRPGDVLAPETIPSSVAPTARQIEAPEPGELDGPGSSGTSPSEALKFAGWSPGEGAVPNSYSLLEGPEAADVEVERLRQELMGILATWGGQRGEWGVLAVSLDRGDTLLALNERISRVPASNMKLLSTATALHYLGPDFRYHTFLLSNGALSGSRLSGDLVLYGTGDPSLSARFYASETAPLDSLAAQIAAAGVTEIHGDLVVDGSYFQGPDRHPDWDPADLNDAFAAPVSAVEFNENLVTVRVSPGAWPGAEATIRTMPEQAGIPVLNLARTVASGSPSRVWLLRETPFDPIGIEGQIPMGGREVWRRLPVTDPLSFTGVQLARALELRGVTVTGTVRTIRSQEESPMAGQDRISGDQGHRLRILALETSPPLLDILRVVNKESNNFLAESVAKTVGRVVLGDGSFAGAQAVIQGFLTDVVGVSADEVLVQDGSGLSPTNRASAGVFVRLFEFMASTPEWDAFLDTLPQAGVRGELGRMYRTPAAGNLRAKTGTMTGVSALSGLVRTRSGEQILFSILSNQVPSTYRAKRAEDQLGVRLASLTRPLPN